MATPRAFLSGNAAGLAYRQAIEGALAESRQIAEELLALGDAFGALSGAGISNDQLEEMALTGAYTLDTVLSRDIPTDLVTSAEITWRDASPGTMTGTVSSSDGGYSSVVFVHGLSEKTVTITITWAGGKISSTATAIT